MDAQPVQRVLKPGCVAVLRFGKHHHDRCIGSASAVRPALAPFIEEFRDDALDFKKLEVQMIPVASFVKAGVQKNDAEAGRGNILHRLQYMIGALLIRDTPLPGTPDTRVL